MSPTISDVDDQPQYNRLLISSPGFYRHFKLSNLSVWIYDQSSIPFLIEEFVACSALEIIVPAHSLAERGLKDLSPLLRDRVRIADENGTIAREVDAILTPLYEEFCVEGPYGSPMDFDALDDFDSSPSVNAVGALRRELYEFLLGGRLHLQVGLQFDRLKLAVNFLRARARSANARACLAILVAAISTYQPVTIPAVSLLPAARDEQICRFHAFVEDESYRQLSRHAGLLGIPTACRRAVQLMKRQVRRLLDSPVASAVLKSGSKTISALTKVPALDRELLQCLVDGPYFPPIVSMVDVYARARKQWSKTVGTADELFRAYPDSGYADFFASAERHLGEPFVEVRNATQPPRHAIGSAGWIVLDGKSWQRDMFAARSATKKTRVAKRAPG